MSTDWSNTAVIYACSHRAGGNSRRAAELMAEGVAQAGGKAEILDLRDYSVLHCLACGGCARDAQSRCVLRAKDQAEELFAPLLSSPVVAVASPVYFYALPSLFKTLIDRSQRFWEARRKGEDWLCGLPPRRGFACLVAGQPTGDKLFEGPRLTLKYFLNNFGITLEAPLVLRGLDGPGDLGSDSGASARVLELGRALTAEPRG